jgi:putative flippase GtrA
MKAVVQEAIRYGAVSGCAFIIDITVLFILVRYLSGWYVAAATASFLVGLGVHYLIAKCGAACFTFVWNFLARRHFLFVNRSAS